MERQPRPETAPSPHLEVPYISAARVAVRERIPGQAGNFDTFFDLMNQELMGEGKGKGLFVWESKKYPGVRFLAAQVHVSRDWIKKLSPNKKESAFEIRGRIRRQVRFGEPALGNKLDGSGLSALDMAFSPILDMTNMISSQIERGDEPIEADYYALGSPSAIGGTTTEAFNEAVRKAKDNGIGFDPYGEIYAEFMKDHLPNTEEELKSTRVVLEGVSKGTITADRTLHHLTEDIKARTQVLLDNPAGVHGHNIPTRIGRGLNMLLFLGEAGVRLGTNNMAKTLDKTQPQFYKDIAKKLEIPEPDEEQKKLKGHLSKTFRGLETSTLVHGAPIHKRERKFVRVATPDSANINFKVIRRAFRFGRLPQDERTLQNLATQEGNMIIFPNSNHFLHMWNWLKNIESGAWERKMNAIVRAEPPKKPEEGK